MIATAAESNPTCFSTAPLTDLIKTFTPGYVRLVGSLENLCSMHVLINFYQCRHLDNHFSSTKFCSMSFKGGSKTMKKSERQELQLKLHKAKKYDDLNGFVGNIWNGEEEMKEIARAIDSRALGILNVDLPLAEEGERREGESTADQITTPIEGGNINNISGFFTPQMCEPIPTPSAPLMPSNDRRLASLVSLQDIPTPTPTPRPRLVELKQ